jgi:hypothetical protein
MPRAPAPDAKPVRLKVWRAVEAQHVVSTLRLVRNDPAAHETLESILETSKPPLPASVARLHYLLATPFRYRHPSGSRFRGPLDPGVFYSAEQRRTACAEAGYWRWRFVRDSAGLTSIDATPQTVFQAGVDGAAIDLREPPFVSRRSLWTHPSDYGPTRQIAGEVRESGAAMIRYESVRDPLHGGCVAVLDAVVFTPKRPMTQETWYLTVVEQGAFWRREREREGFDFRFAAGR